MTNFIKDFWNNQAKEFKGHHSASWQDYHAIDLEFTFIRKQLKDINGGDVLDVGCANGFATIKQAQLSDLNFLGIDFSEEMIKYAMENLKLTKLKNVNFDVGNVLEIMTNDNTFDFVYTTRVLINLQNWELQKQAIDECIRVTKPGGKVVFLEGFYEPLVKLNSIRTILGLEPLYEHDFNRYLKKEKLEAFLNDKGLRYTNCDFSGLYYLGSRILREIVTEYEKYPGYTNPLNDAFHQLQTKYSGGGLGIQQAYIIKL